MSTYSPRTPTHTKNGKKGEHIQCFGCKEILEENHAGIQCAQSHHLCMDCSSNLVASFIAEPNINLPPRCVICKIELNPSVFERQLAPYQFEKYTSIMLTLLWSKDCLKDNEELIHCAFCSYTEIRVKSPGAQFMFCKHEDCQKTSCLICLHEVPMLEENYDEDDDEEYEDNMEEIEKHFKCLELREAKKILELAIENGQKVACPGCGLAGMKDDACTHMICPECQTCWCYFCGLKEIDCDKDEQIESTVESGPAINRHNIDWDNNPKRCPMYLTSICDIDQSWPDDDEYECLEYFHRIHSRKYLRQAYEQLGPEIIQQLNEQFNIIDACGFTLEDIKYGIVELIDYENHDYMSEEETDSQEFNVDLLTADEDEILDEDVRHQEFNGDLLTADKNEILDEDVRHQEFNGDSLTADEDEILDEDVRHQEFNVDSLTADEDEILDEDVRHQEFNGDSLTADEDEILDEDARHQEFNGDSLTADENGIPHEDVRYQEFSSDSLTADEDEILDEDVRYQEFNGDSLTADEDEILDEDVRYQEFNSDSLTVDEDEISDEDVRYQKFNVDSLTVEEDEILDEDVRHQEFNGDLLTADEDEIPHEDARYQEFSSDSLTADEDGILDEDEILDEDVRYQKFNGDSLTADEDEISDEDDLYA